MHTASTKPYILRALYEWCIDQGFTPYVAVVVDAHTDVPNEYVKDGQIILNIGPEAVHQLQMGNDVVRCAARFGGVARTLHIPVVNVAAIYARENGHGMAFDVAADKASLARVAEEREVTPKSDPPRNPPGSSRPKLTRIK